MITKANPKLHFSRKLLAIPYGLFLALFVVLPLLIIVYYAFFNDKGIDARVYNRIPVIADGSEIYAVCGVDISKKLAVNNKTDKIIKLTCERKGD